MKLFRCFIAAALFVVGNVHADIIDEAFQKLNGYVCRYQNVKDLTLQYRHVYEQIPLCEEGAYYLARKQQDKSLRDSMRGPGGDEAEPFVVPADFKETYDAIVKSEAERYQGHRTSAYDYKVRIRKIQLEDRVVFSTQETTSLPGGSDFYYRSENSDGFLTISQKKEFLTVPNATQEVTVRLKDRNDKRYVIPLPLEWLTFFDHQPQNDPQYRKLDDDVLEYSYRTRKNGYDNAVLTLRIGKMKDTYVPLYYEEIYENSIQYKKFDKYVQRYGVFLPSYVERGYLIPEDRQKTPHWDPSIVRYTLK